MANALRAPRFACDSRGSLTLRARFLATELQTLTSYRWLPTQPDRTLTTDRARGLGTRMGFRNRRLRHGLPVLRCSNSKPTMCRLCPGTPLRSGGGAAIKPSPKKN
jgi:hypothetical protein